MTGLELWWDEDVGRRRGVLEARYLVAHPLTFGAMIRHEGFDWPKCHATVLALMMEKKK